MPQLDKTGPQGAGPRTGRGMGNCAPPKKGQDPATDARGRGMGMRNRAPQGTPGGQGQGMRRRAPQGTGGRRGR